MKYKKGNIVEVLSNNQFPSYSWRCAKIVSGNGHNYTVRYDIYPGVVNDEIMGHVSRKLIRPSPPVVEVEDNLIPGDLVEVFHSHSWKMAAVSKMLDRDRYLVRIVGSTQEFGVRKFELRARKLWQDDKWVIIGQASRNRNCRKADELSASKYSQYCQVKPKDAKQRLWMKDLLNSNDIQESRIVSSKTLKRGSPCCVSQVEANERSAPKYRVVEQEGTRQRVLATLPEHVNLVTASQEMLGVNSLHTFAGDREVCISDKMEREKSSGGFRCSGISVEPNRADSVAASVGSCSVDGDDNHGVDHFESHSSDAESFCQLVDREETVLTRPQKKLESEIHGLELHAYRCTLEALHATGPLSWERETMLTDLRISLRISNDEHLMEVRKLVPAAYPALLNR